MPVHGEVTPMTALFVSTSMTSLSRFHGTPSLKRTLMIVASAMDSPSCGINIGTWAIGLHFQKSLHRGGNRARSGTMGCPQIRMIGTGVSLALSRCGGASSRPSPSAVTRATTSAATPPQGQASLTQTGAQYAPRTPAPYRCPAVSRFLDQRLQFRNHPRQVLRPQQGLMEHRAVCDNGSVASLPGEPRLERGMASRASFPP